MTVIQVGGLRLIAAGATAVVLTRDPLQQAMVVSFYGLHSLVWRFCQRRLTATPKLAAGCSEGVKRSSGP